MKSNNYLTTILAIGLVIALLYSLSNPAENTIEASGEYTLTTEPDQAEFTITITTQAETEADARDKNAVIVDRIRDAIEKIDGFRREETQSFNIYPDNRWDEGETIREGYKATHSIRVYSNTEAISQIIDSAVNIASEINKNERESINIGSTSFSLSEEQKQEYFEEALEKAAKEAENKAKAIANSLGVTIKGVNSVKNSYVSAGSNYYPVYKSAMEDAAGMSTEISEENQIITASITVSFKI